MKNVIIVLLAALLVIPEIKSLVAESPESQAMITTEEASKRPGQRPCFEKTEFTDAEVKQMQDLFFGHTLKKVKNERPITPKEQRTNGKPAEKVKFSVRELRNHMVDMKDDDLVEFEFASFTFPMAIKYHCYYKLDDEIEYKDIVQKQTLILKSRQVRRDGNGIQIVEPVNIIGRICPPPRGCLSQFQ